MSRTIEATVTVGPDGEVSGRLPPDIPPGEHRILLLLDDPSGDLPGPADAPRPEPPVDRALSGARPHDFFAPPLTLEQLAAAQGVAPVTDFESMLGDFWPDQETTEEFLDTLRTWRREGDSRRRAG